MSFSGVGSDSQALWPHGSCRSLPPPLNCPRLKSIQMQRSSCLQSFRGPRSSLTTLSNVVSAFTSLNVHVFWNWNYPCIWQNKEWRMVRFKSPRGCVLVLCSSFLQLPLESFEVSVKALLANVFSLLRGLRIPCDFCSFCVLRSQRGGTKWELVFWELLKTDSLLYDWSVWFVLFY